MKTSFTIKEAGAKFSPAEMYLAARLRTLKSVYSNKKDKDSFAHHMMAEMDGKSFTKSECARLYKAMQVITFYDKTLDAHIAGIDKESGKLLFRREYYSNNSNFFENYAKQILEEGEIITPRGRVPGKHYSDEASHIEAMRVAKAAKKAGTWSQVPNGVVDPNGKFHEDLFHVITPKEKPSQIDGLRQAVHDQEDKVSSLERQLSHEKEVLSSLEAALNEAIKEEEAKKLNLFNTLSQMAKDEGYDLNDLVKSYSK